MQKFSKNHDLLRRLKSSRGFTLIELAIVVIIIGIMAFLISTRAGSLNYIREENFIRQFAETLEFLHYQAITDQAFYRVDFNLAKNTYRVGVLKDIDDSQLQQLLTQLQGVGQLSIELAAFLNPSIGKTQELIPPPSLPSLADIIKLPNGMSFIDVRTMRGKSQPTGLDSDVYLLFSPRGFSEFGVVHFQRSDLSQLSILINPFTGKTEIYREYKDFEWTFGRKDKNV